MATVDTTPGHRQGLERDQTTGTGDGIRTHTLLRAAVFKTAAATITPPRRRVGDASRRLTVATGLVCPSTWEPPGTATANRWRVATTEADGAHEVKSNDRHGARLSG